MLHRAHHVEPSGKNVATTPTPALRVWSGCWREFGGVQARRPLPRAKRDSGLWAVSIYGVTFAQFVFGRAMVSPMMKVLP
jgi:hypothetical protein